MRKSYNYLILFFTLSSVIVKAQDYDSIKDGDIKINNFSLDQTTSSLVTILGTPSSIGSYHNEVDEEDWLEFKYGLSSFYFFNTKLVSFELKDSSFYLNNPLIKVGNAIDSIYTVFESSFNNKDVLNNLGFINIDIVMPDGTLSDTNIVINYDPSTNNITSIHFGSN